MTCLLRRTLWWLLPLSESENRRSSIFSHCESVKVTISGSVDTTVIPVFSLFYLSLVSYLLAFFGCYHYYSLKFHLGKRDSPSLGVMYYYIRSTIFNGRITWSWLASLATCHLPQTFLCVLLPGIFIFTVLVPPAQVFVSSFFIFSNHTQFLIRECSWNCWCSDQYITQALLKLSIQQGV